MKPRTNPNVVLGNGSVIKDRIHHARNVGTAVLDSITAPQYMREDTNRTEESAIKYSTTRAIESSDKLRSIFDKELVNGVSLKAKTVQGGKVTALGTKSDADRSHSTGWKVVVESAKGVVTGFDLQINTSNVGSATSERNSADLIVLNPENGKAYDMSRYGENDTADAYESVALALEALALAENNGTLQVTPIPPASLSQQAPSYA